LPQQWAIGTYIYQHFDIFVSRVSPRADKYKHILVSTLCGRDFTLI
jgi:hypothetical protein